MQNLKYWFLLFFPLNNAFFIVLKSDLKNLSKFHCQIIDCHLLIKLSTLEFRWKFYYLVSKIYCNLTDILENYFLIP